ncbi:Asp23/Gls24 family envelope stress response protein [Microbispora sp. RL4-1S]|uniref:Asp23/Gls24 family envelope stress response protein n=1 Tax=Microbispora oryzae TaxID=2806554 RepID=A0A940WVD6_9ACTN|nr:Asp23/Gls24 family envelope stress response protein [Microbispora oryzae]MBP2708090.1 Asp23/Gls24 family envelope stress response protein [Microbispora oryzae]
MTEVVAEEHTELAGELPDEPAEEGLTGQEAASEPRTGAADAPAGPAADELRGRITVADEVVEKVAALAALEITGVADLGGDLERAFESVRDRIGIGAKRATQGVQAKILEQGVTVDVTIVIVYGHVVMDVAREVKLNVARSVSRMLGMRVTEVNVTVDDVRLPGEGRPAEAAEPAA